MVFKYQFNNSNEVCKMNIKDIEIEINNAFSEANEIALFIQKCIDNHTCKTDDIYIKTNHVYFRICRDFYISAMTLIDRGYTYSAIVILRSFIETFTKAMYIEFIYKPERTDILPLISGSQDFPNFVNMSQNLDKFISEYQANTNQTESIDFFKQFTKRGLAQYQKFSFFTHSRGEYVMNLLESDNVRLDPRDIRDLILTAKGLYESFTLFYFGVQGKNDELRLLIEKLMESNQYQQ